jgi:ATP-binding cassette subfamily B protein
MAADEFSGLASLVYVARKRGIETTVDSLSRRFGQIDFAASPALLASIAGEIGLSAKRLNLSWRDLTKLKRSLPALLLLRDDSVVVLDSVHADPAAGLIATLIAPTRDGESTVVVDEAQLKEAWSGDIVLLKRKLRQEEESKPFDLAWLAAQVFNERKLFRDIGIASLFATAFALAPPFITMIVIDRVIVNHSVSTLWVISGAFGLLILFEVLMGFLRRLFMQVTATRIDGRLNLYVMDRLLKLPMDYFERTPTGYTLGRLSQLYRIRAFLTGQVFGTFLDLVTLVGLIPALLLLSWKLSLFVFVCAGAIFAIIYFYLKPLARRHGKVILAEREKDAFLTETVYGMRAIKSLSLEDRRRSEWDVKVAEATLMQYREGELANYPQTFVVPFERLMFSGSIIIGAAIALFSPTAVYPGALMAFSMLAGRTAQPLVQLARLMSDFGEIQGAVGEVAAVMNTAPEDLRSGSGLKLPVRGHITFDKVEFRYAPGTPLALSGASFTVQPGAIFGIMGRSGSGKTTITRLLQRLHSSYEGLIKIDGVDVREFDVDHLRSSLGVVLQENFLFSGTIRENIGMARPNATFSEIVRAAQMAGAEEFIERMPRGYDTFLQEGGANLSGGQRQRLAIARALVVDPPVLILDEATSALDAESEAIINANLLRIAQSRTIICVSHRLAMLVPADAILVMEKGKVYDIGTHQELLHRCDIYKHMWYTQNRHSQPGASNAPLTIAHSS